MAEIMNEEAKKSVIEFKGRTETGEEISGDLRLGISEDGDYHVEISITIGKEEEEQEQK